LWLYLRLIGREIREAVYVQDIIVILSSRVLGVWKIGDNEEFSNSYCEIGGTFDGCSYYPVVSLHHTDFK